MKVDCITCGNEFKKFSRTDKKCGWCLRKERIQDERYKMKLQMAKFGMKSTGSKEVDGVL